MELSNREKALLAVTAITIIVAAAIILTVIVRIRNVGRIKAIGVKFYWDEVCTNEALEIDWGLCEPGATYGVTLHCKNVKNIPVTLNLTTNNWEPSNANLYIYEDWNYTASTVIQPGEVIPIQFQLSIDPAISDIDQFSFDYVVGVTEHEG